MSFGKGLQFAQGVSREVQIAIARMFPEPQGPKDLLGAYRQAQASYGTNDIVLVVAAHDPELITSFPRAEYVRAALKGEARQKERVARESAHQIVRIPAEGDAFWLVIEDRKLPIPVMSVLYTVPYKTEAVSPFAN